MKNRMATLLMETGQEYNKKKLHGAKYFRELLEKIQDVPESFKEILQMSRGALELFESCPHSIISCCIAGYKMYNTYIHFNERDVP